MKLSRILKGYTKLTPTYWIPAFGLFKYMNNFTNNKEDFTSISPYLFFGYWVYQSVATSAVAVTLSELTPKVVKSIESLL